MKLNELNTPMFIHDAAEKLKASGWFFHDKGGLGTVFAKEDTPYVLKLFDNQDRAYIAFVRLVQQHPNIHFPKFVGKLIRINNIYSAVRMERLEKSNGKINSSDGKHIAFYLSQNYYFKRMESGEITFDDFNPRYEETYDYMQANPELKEACDLISDHLLKIYSLDIFGISDDSNLMLRGDVIVITDPVSMD